MDVINYITVIYSSRSHPFSCEYTLIQADSTHFSQRGNPTDWSVLVVLMPARVYYNYTFLRLHRPVIVPLHLILGRLSSIKVKRKIEPLPFWYSIVAIHSSV